MAERTTFLVPSVTGISGNRTSSCMRPRTDAAYFTGDGLVSTNRRIVERHEAILHFHRGRIIALEAGILELGAEARRRVGRDRDAAVAAMSHEAERGGVLAGKLEEVGTHGPALLADPGDVGRRVLHADNVRKLIEPRHGIDRHVDHRAGRNIIDEDRDADRIVDRLEMRVHACLGRLVVIGRDDQDRVRPHLLGMPARTQSPRRYCSTRRPQSPGPCP